MDSTAYTSSPASSPPDTARRQHTQDHDGHDHEVQFEDLAAVDDEKAEACLRGEKFPMMTPTRQRPMLTFMLLMMSGRNLAAGPL